jgi:hypothetical protein
LAVSFTVSTPFLEQKSSYHQFQEHRHIFAENWPKSPVGFRAYVKIESLATVVFLPPVKLPSGHSLSKGLNIFS